MSMSMLMWLWFLFSWLGRVEVILISWETVKKVILTWICGVLVLLCVCVYFCWVVVVVDVGDNY